jgi:non-specific protein-tyrosine kinase
LVIAVFATVVGAIALSASQKPIYSAEAQMLVKTRPDTTVFSTDTRTFGDPVRAVQTEIKVLESEPVAERVQADLKLTVIPPSVKGAVQGATDVVSVTVRSGDPTTARIVADAYVQAYIETKREQAVATLTSAGAELQKKVTELQLQLDALDRQVTAATDDQLAQMAPDLTSQRRVLEDQQSLFKQRLDQLQVDSALTTGGADVVRQAALPSTPVEPRPVRTAALAVVVGLLLGLGAVFLIDHFDDSIRGAEDVQRAVGLPVLAMVPIDPPPDNRPIALSRAGDYAVEVYRSLRTSVQFLGLDSETRVIQVTSPGSGDGKTTTAANLAVVFADIGHRVVLVDADLRKPRLHDMFSLPPDRGLTTALLGESVQRLVHTVTENLDVLPAGPIPPNPSELVGGRQMQILIKALAAHYGFVIIDSAPVLPVSDSVGLASLCGGVLLVAQAGRTSARQMSDAVSLLERVQTPMLGVVLNKVGTKRRQKYAYGYEGQTYRYRAHETSTPPSPPPPPPPSPEEAPEALVRRVRAGEPHPSNG